MMAHRHQFLAAALFMLMTFVNSFYHSIPSSAVRLNGPQFTASALSSSSIDKHSYSSTEALAYRSRETKSHSSTAGSVISLDLPTLTSADLAMLEAGERVQKQRRNGRAGTGWVVVDADASPEVIFQELAQFGSYEEMIPTVRGVDKYYETSDVCKAEFSLSKFRLKINAEHKIYPEQHLIRFKLDSERPNLVLRQATGFWLVEPHPDRPAASRVWLSARIVASRVVPTLVVDYAACRALPRATNWIQPHFARAQK